MRVIMTMLIFLAVLAVVSAISGIQSVHSDPSTGTVITYHHGLTRFYALASAAVFAAVFYAIYKKRLIAWWVGWIVLVVSAIDTLSISLPPQLRDPSPYRWYSSAGTVVAICAVTAFWGYWWYKQRNVYFSKEEDEQV
jgi:hypothetical protein